MNTEYVIIPICIPNNETDYLKVSGIPISIWHRDDETGILIDSLAAEREAVNKAAQIYGWTDGKLDFVYGFSTAGGIGDSKSAQKANERLIDKLRRSTKKDYYQSKF